MNKIKAFYENNYKVLLIIPFLLLAFSLIQIGVQYSTTGDFVHKGVSLSGGSSISIPISMSDAELSNLEADLQKDFTTAGLSVRSLSSAGSTIAVVIESSFQDDSELEP